MHLAWPIHAEGILTHLFAPSFPARTNLTLSGSTAIIMKMQKASNKGLAMLRRLLMAKQKGLVRGKFATLSSKTARLAALLCLPYILLALSSPLFHTCTDDKPNSQPTRCASILANKSGQAHSRIFTFTPDKPLKGQHKQCAVCMWVKSAVGSIQLSIVLVCVQAVSSLVNNPTPNCWSTPQLIILPRAPPTNWSPISD